MAFVFGNDTKRRGCYHQMTLFLDPSGALFQWPETAAAAGAVFPTVDTDPYLITALSFSEKEKYHLVQCFNDYNYTYAFGHDPASSLVNISFIAFVTAKDGFGNSAAIPDFVRQYKDTRLSQSLEYGWVSVGNQVLGGYVVGMQSQTADSHFNLQRFNVVLLGVEVHG